MVAIYDLFRLCREAGFAAIQLGQSRLLCGNLLQRRRVRQRDMRVLTCTARLSLKSCQFVALVNRDQ